jgi:hypothetical protein
VEEIDLVLDLKLGWHDRNDVEEAGRDEKNRGNLG